MCVCVYVCGYVCVCVYVCVYINRSLRNRSLRSRFWFKLSGIFGPVANHADSNTMGPERQIECCAAGLASLRTQGARRGPPRTLRATSLHGASHDDGHSWSFRGPPPTIVEPPPLSASMIGVSSCGRLVVYIYAYVYIHVMGSQLPGCLICVRTYGWLYACMYGY